MAYIKINHEKVNEKIANDIVKLCPFNAFDYNQKTLVINASCRLCKACVKRAPNGILEFIEDQKVLIDKSKYKGILVYIEHLNNKISDVSLELITKAKELAKTTKDEIYAIVIGNNVLEIAKETLRYGPDKVFLYDDPLYNDFNVERFTKVFEHFFQKYQNNIILVGATPLGRSFAPRIAAKLKTGLTADCTMLELTKNADLLQIRPAFGGNIMAKIHTPNSRPQMATVRPKVFNKENPSDSYKGIIIKEDLKEIDKSSTIQLLKRFNKESTQNISDASVIIAVGRAFKKAKDLELIEPLRKKLNAVIGCTRPLVENSWMDIKTQIGLSGRTVKPKLIINLGISGAVHFIEGMKDSELIITVNNDPNCKLFEISHYAILGDIYEVIPKLSALIEKLVEV